MVNIDHGCYTTAGSRTSYPDLWKPLFLVEEAGAEAITIHLREDRRIYRIQDVYDIRKQIRGRMNLEVAATDEMVNIACDVNPERCMCSTRKT